MVILLHFIRKGEGGKRHQGLLKLTLVMTISGWLYLAGLVLHRYDIVSHGVYLACSIASLSVMAAMAIAVIFCAFSAYQEPANLSA